MKVRIARDPEYATLSGIDSVSEVIGNIYENPELLNPARTLKEHCVLINTARVTESFEGN